MSSEPKFNKIANNICREKTYKLPSYIGAGAFKEAYYTELASGIPATLKVFNPVKCDSCRAEREFTAMQQCNSPHIGKLYGYGVHRAEDGTSYLYVMEEYLSGGTLGDKLKIAPIGMLAICNYGIDLIKAISHLKDNALVHRDIKPDNILFRDKEDSPVLVDFGLVRVLHERSLTHSFLPQGPGTPFYASPEQLNNDKHLIDWRSDQFSLGVLLAICLTGCHPYCQDTVNDVQIVERVLSRAKCSESVKSQLIEMGFGFVIKMISPWPIERYSKPVFIQQELETLKRSLIV